MRRSLVGGLAAAALLLTGCFDAGGTATDSNGSHHHGSTSSGAGAGSLKAYYRQKLDWTHCGEDVCATLKVPVDYAHPGGASIGLNVEKAKATGDRVGALVVNPGGPGAPGVGLASSRSDYFGQALISAYDIVGFDPRGTGGSDPIDCMSDQQVDRYVAEDPDPDNAAEVKQFTRSARQFWNGCKTRSDGLVGHVSTIDAARDMDILRAALGQKKMDYFGFSYGTKLGATYAELFPRRVGRMVLDGAIDVALSTRESSLHQAAGFETALRAYVGNCVSSGSCFLGDTVEAGLQRIKSLLNHIDTHPLPTGSGRELTVGNAFYGLVMPLYARSMWTYLDTGLKKAMAGDGSVLLALADAYTSRGSSGGYSDNSLEAISVINCEDSSWSVAPSAVASELPAFLKASPTFGSVFAWGLTACHGMPFKAAPPLKIDAAGAPPIVVIGTTRDPATPYEEAVALSKELTSGVLLSRDGDGHTGYNKGNACIDDAVEGYLIRGDVPADGKRC
ncbi:alpha/beta hydrolase [Nocardioides montaniterrae]